MAMGADAKQSGSSGSEAMLLSALEVSVDMGRCPAALRRMGAAALGIWCHLFLQGPFNEDFKDGHISEDIVAMIATGAWNAMMAVWCCWTAEDKFVSKKYSK